MRRVPLSSRVGPGALLFTSIALFFVGCAEGPASAPKTEGYPTETPYDPDAPLQLSYVCGNRFLITNANLLPVTVSYRVEGSDEGGIATVAAGAQADPWFSEQLIEVRTSGTVTLSVGGRPVVVRANGKIACSPNVPEPSFLSTSSATEGSWTVPFHWPVVAVSMSLLPDGKVLSWGHVGAPQLWDPESGVFTAVPSPVLLFCAGQALDGSGQLVVAGGHITDNHGLPNITFFNWETHSWSSGPLMLHGRWYPTATTMASGEVVITSGKDQSGTKVLVPELENSGGLEELNGASLNLAYYPRTFLAPNGKLFYAGEAQMSRYLDISGSGLWTNLKKRLYGIRDYGAAVMYDEGKILYVGGGNTTNTAETIDLIHAPFWTWTGSMAYPRRHLNATVLPTGQVLVTGGLSGTGFSDITTAVHPAELWDPASGQWSILASNTANRGYHSTAILLPDARVLVAGSGDAAGEPRELTAEIFSPPYLFEGARPAIGSAPHTVSYGAPFRVETPDAGAIAKVSLIRLGSTTHAFDMNQRFQWLSWTADAQGLTISGPSNRNITPPGHYLLFILNGTGVPSVGWIVQVT